MTTYGPVSGITKESLMDLIISNAVASGGWTLLHDRRDPARIPTSPGFQSILRKSKAELTTNIGDVVNYNNFPQTAILSNGAIYFYLLRYQTATGNNELTRYISNDGVTFAQSESNLSNSNRGYAVTGTKMASTNTYWWYRLDSNISYGQSGTAPSTSQAADGSISLVPFYGSTPNVSSPAAGSAYVMVENADYVILAALVNIVQVPSALAISFFRQSQSLSTTALLGEIRPADYGLQYIYGVDYMINNGTAIDIFLTVLNASGEIKTIQMRNEDPTFTVFSPVIVSLNPLFPPGVNGSKLFSTAILDPTGAEIASITNTEYTYTSGNAYTNLSTTATSFASATEGVDSNPDLAGVQHEYVILQSTYSLNSGSGYRLMIAQVDPVQAAQPSVLGVTDALPIMIRPIRGGIGDPSEISRLFIDPIVPATTNAIGPAILSVPVVGAAPEEVHKVWMRIDDRQIFVFTEATNGLRQMLNVNIPTPTFAISTPSNVEERNDNFVVSSSGIPAMTATIYLGRNGSNEVTSFDARNNGEPYYPLASELTYSTALAAVNAVDNKEYIFKVFIGSNSADLSQAGAVSGEFIVGDLYKTFFLPNSLGKISGDTVLVNATTYKYFSPSNSAASNQSNMLQQNIVVEWT